MNLMILWYSHKSCNHEVEHRHWIFNFLQNHCIPWRMSTRRSSIISVQFSMKLHINKKCWSVIWFCFFFSLIWKRDKSKRKKFLTQALDWELNILKGRLNCKYIEWTSLLLSITLEESLDFEAQRRIRTPKTPKAFYCERTELFKHLINRFSRVNLSFSLKISSNGINISKRQILSLFCRSPQM